LPKNPAHLFPHLAQRLKWRLRDAEETGMSADAARREAQCSCGSIKIVTWGEPNSIVACHCIDCQRRTGSVFGVGAYFPEATVQVSGDPREFVRTTAAGNEFHTYFCPNCGSSTHWRSNRNPGLLGIAVGAFADAAFPKPMRSVWERSRHSWVDLSSVEQHFTKGRER
jgi:hypothetical protein